MPVRVLQTTGATATTMPWIPLNIHEDDAPVRFVVNKGVSFTRTYQIQFTLDEPIEQGVSAFPVTAVDAAVEFTSAVIDPPIAAVRLVVASGSASATTNFRVLQGGI